VDRLEGEDKIGELIDAFKSLVKGMSVRKTNAKTEMAVGNSKMGFSKNFDYGNHMPWRSLLDNIP
jgi:hypothetical protein